MYSTFREALMKKCWAREPKDRPAASEIVEYIANSGKLLYPSMDVPISSITLKADDEYCHDEEFPFGFGRARPRDKGPPTDFEVLRRQILSMAASRNSNNCPPPPPPRSRTTEEDSAVSIQLDNNYCPKAPLLGTNKSSNSLISFGKFNMQNNRTDSGYHNEDDPFENGHANGFVNSKL